MKTTSSVFFALRNNRNIFTGFYVTGLSGNQAIGLKLCFLTILLLLLLFIIIFHILYFRGRLSSDYIHRYLKQDLAFFNVRLTPDLILSFLAGEIHPDKTPVAKIQDSDTFSWNRTNKTEIKRELKSFSLHFLVSGGQFETQKSLTANIEDRFQRMRIELHL